MGWQDREWNGDTGAPVLPFIQWVHRPHQVGQEMGGWFQPAEQAALQGGPIPGVRAEFLPNGGEPEEGTYARCLRVAVLKTRSRIVKGRGREAQILDEWEDGARSKVQAACLVAGERGEVYGAVFGPVTLTVKSTTAGEFWAAMREHREAVRRATAGKAPPYAFWMDLEAAGTKEIKGSTVTTLKRGGDGCNPERDYVGDAALDAVNWEQLESWAAAWENGNGSNGNTSQPKVGESRSQTGPEPTGPNAATGAQMKRIRDLLVSLGYTTGERQNQVLAEQGFDVLTITAEEAVDLIDRLEVALDAAPGGE